MKKISIGLLFATLAAGQIPYTASKTTALSSSAEVVTIQQPAASAKIVRFISAFVDSTAACTITIERNGTPASSTALTPNPSNPDQAAAVSTAYSGSNVGTGSVITRASVPAGGGIVVDLSKVYLRGNDKSQNLSVRTGSCTGTVDIVITYTESSN